MGSIRVLIVDDHTVVRQGLRALLHGAEGIEVVGDGGDGHEAVAMAEQLQPDVVLMDVVMPNMDGAEATAAILSSHAAIRIVALSGADIDERIFAAIRAGAQGYVSKSAPQEELVAVIREVAQGRTSMPAEMTRRLLARLEPPRPNREELSQREVEILRLVAKGLSNRQVGGRIHISEATVRTHISNILAKLGVSNRVEATLHALRDGVTTLEECLEPKQLP